MQPENTPTETEEITETEQDENTPTDQEEKPPAAADPLQQIGQGFVQDWPEPVQHFVDATKERLEADELAEKPQAAADPLQIRDKNKNYFDPAKVLTDEDGLPLFTKTGLFELRRGVKRKDLPKKPLQEVEKPEIRQQIEQQRSAQEAAALAARVKTNASLCMAGYVQLNSMINGQEVVNSVLGATLAAVKDAQGKEHKFTFYDVHQLSLERALACMDGGPEVNPWLALVGVFGFSSISMFFHAKHASRRTTLKEKLILLWLRVRGKRVIPTKPAHKNGGENA